MNNLAYVISQGPREKQSYSEEEDVINEGLPLEGCTELGNQHKYLAPSTSIGGSHSYSEVRPEKQGRCYHYIQVTGKPPTRAMVTWLCWVSHRNAVLRRHQLSVPQFCVLLAPSYPSQPEAFVGVACRLGSP